MYELRVEGMSCGGCARRITKAVKALDAMAKVDIDLKNKAVYVQTNATLDTVLSAIAAAGFSASVIAVDGGLVVPPHL